MTEWQQAAGDLAQTALTAAAIERERGAGGTPGPNGHSHEQACLNCGTALIGTHCHQCGQHAHVHRTLGAFFHDLLHGVFHFEGRIWHTLPLLVFRPGQLTRRYIDGQRVRFVSPLALFLFSVFLMFTVFHAVVGEMDIDPRTMSTSTPQQQAEAQQKAEQKLARLQAERAALVASHQPTAGLDGQIQGAEVAVDVIKGMRGDGSGGIQADFDGLGLDKNGKPARISDVPAIQHAYEEFKTNPKLVFYKLQSNAYKYSWALIPISVPFLWLLFPFSRRFHLYDHTVFVTYSLSMMTLLAVIGMLWGKLAIEPGPELLLLAPPVHMYAQLRGTYGGSRLGTLLRMALLQFFALLALILFTMLILAQTGA